MIDGLRDWEPAAPRPWLATRRLVAVVLGVVCGGVFVLWVAVVLP